MSQAKQELIRLIKEQPSASTMEDVVCELAIYVAVMRALADVDVRRGIPHAEVGRLIQEWFDEAQSKSQREE